MPVPSFGAEEPVPSNSPANASSTSGAVSSTKQDKASSGSSSETDAVPSKRHSALAPTTYGAWIGVSHDSPAGVFLGMTPGRDFNEFAIRFGWRFIDQRFVRAEYTVDLIPLAMVNGNPIVVTDAGGRFRPSRTEVIGYQTEYGVGAAPFGLKLGVPVDRVFVFVSGSAGFLAFSGEVPVPGASFFNYTFDFGGGLEFALTEHWGIVGGYKLHHLSNGDQALMNPGIDSNEWYFGTSFLR